MVGYLYRPRQRKKWLHIDGQTRDTTRRCRKAEIEYQEKKIRGIDTHVDRRPFIGRLVPDRFKEQRQERIRCIAKTRADQRAKRNDGRRDSKNGRNRTTYMKDGRSQRVGLPFSCGIRSRFSSSSWGGNYRVPRGHLRRCEVIPGRRVRAGSSSLLGRQGEVSHHQQRILEDQTRGPMCSC